MSPQDPSLPSSRFPGGSKHGFGASEGSVIPGLVLTPTKGSGARNGAPRDLSLDEVVLLLRTNFAIIRSRWIHGLIAAVIVGAVLGYALLRKKPEPRAVTTVLAQSSLDDVLGTAQRGNADVQEDYMRNHLAVIKSRRFSVALAEKFTPEEAAAIMAPYLEPGTEPSRAALERLLAGRIDAERERGRDFFALTFQHSDPDVAVMVANRMTATYLQMVQQELQQANAAAVDILKKQAQALKAEITALENEQRDYRKENNIVSNEENQGILAERLRRIDQQRADFRVQRVRLEAELRKAREDLAADPMPFNNSVLANFGNNQALRQRLDDLKAQREVLSERYGRRHPKMQQLAATIQGVGDNIASNFDLALRDLESQLMNVQTIESDLEKEFLKAFAAGLEIGRLANRLKIMETEIEAKREALSGLLRRVNSAGVVSKLPMDVMRVVDPAYITGPRFARRLIILFLIGTASATAFVGVPLIVHVFDARIKSETDVEKEFGRELLGGVPRLTGVRAEDRPHVVRDNVDPAKVEPFMALVAQLELASVQTGTKVFLVTSTAPEEGKSTLVSNLAAGYTQLGRRTLIVDADLRRPRQHLLHGVDNQYGFLAWARQGGPLQDLLDEGSPLGVQVLADGTHLITTQEDPQPTQHLVSRQTTALFAALRQNYEVVIIDTPPAGLFQDALVLARHAPETLLVAREAKAPIAQIRRTIADLDKTAAPVLGLILNDFSSHNMNPRLAYSRSYGNYAYRSTKVQETPIGHARHRLTKR